MSYNLDDFEDVFGENNCEFVVTQACAGNWGPLRECAVAVSKLALMGVDEDGSELLAKQLKKLSKWVGTAAAFGRLDVVEKTMTEMPILKESLQNLLPNLWALHPPVVIALVPRIGCEPWIVDEILDYADESDLLPGRPDLLRDLLKLARPTSKRAGTFFFEVAKLFNAKRLRGVLKPRWGFLLDFLDQASDVKRLRRELERGEFSEALELVYAKFPEELQPTTSRSPIWVAQDGQTARLRELLLEQEWPPLILMKAFDAACEQKHKECARLLWRALGRPAIDVKLAHRLLLQSDAGVPISLKKLSEETMVGLATCFVREHLGRDHPLTKYEVGSLKMKLFFEAGAPATRRVGMALLGSLAGKHLVGLTVKQWDDLDWFAQLFGTGRPAEGTIFERDFHSFNHGLLGWEEFAARTNDRAAGLAFSKRFPAL